MCYTSNLVGPKAHTIIYVNREIREKKKERKKTKEKLVLKRFVFSSTSIEALKAKYVESSGLEYPIYPSRIEASSAFIWS